MNNNLFEYKDGNLIWKAQPRNSFASDRDHKIWNTRYAGTVAGSADEKGYILVKAGRHLLAHRIIWEMHYGPIPEGVQIDHINGEKGDNRIENLRLATRSQNGCNTKTRRDNTSGVKGVHWHKKTEKWQARIMIEGQRRSIGLFSTLEDAALAVQSARENLHGEFCKHS